MIFQYFQQVWRLCSLSRHPSVRFAKSAVVGSVGVVINLAVMALLLRFTGIHNWRASAIACVAANVQNYLLHGAWSHISDERDHFRNLEGYLSYLVMSAAGLILTILSYGGIGWTLHKTVLVAHADPSHLFGVRLASQFIAIVLGIRFNHILNRMFDWPDLARLNLKNTTKAPLFP